MYLIWVNWIRIFAPVDKVCTCTYILFIYLLNDRYSSTRFYTPIHLPPLYGTIHKRRRHFPPIFDLLPLYTTSPMLVGFFTSMYLSANSMKFWPLDPPSMCLMDGSYSIHTLTQYVGSALQLYWLLSIFFFHMCKADVLYTYIVGEPLHSTLTGLASFPSQKCMLLQNS